MVGLVSASTMKEILEDSNLRADELQIFKMLQLWVNSDKERATIASELSKLIRIDWIDPVALSTAVATSGFVPLEQLADAYKIQAKRRSSLPAWKEPDLKKFCTSTVTTKSSYEQFSLEHYPIKSGSCRWVFEMIEASPFAIWIGMVGMKHMKRFKTALGLSQGWKGSHQFWGCRKDGRVFSDSYFASDTKLRFQTGSKVTFKLNLAADDEGGGTLSASVDGGAYHRLFCNLRDSIDEDCAGFVPALSMSKPACIKLLNFELGP